MKLDEIGRIEQTNDKVMVDIAAIEQAYNNYGPTIDTRLICEAIDRVAAELRQQKAVMEKILSELAASRKKRRY